MKEARQKQFERGMRIEGREHPTLPKKIVAVLVNNHLDKHPYMYKK
jgi:hypothetical protein